MLHGFSMLKILAFVMKFINDEAAEELANIFSQNDILKILDLSHNGLPDDGVIKICYSSARRADS